MLFVLAEGAAVAPPPPATSINAGMRPAGGPHVCAETQYPISALQTGTQGDVILGFTVTTDGRVRDISVFQSSGNTDLDAAARTCAAEWLYRPATRDGVAIDAPWRARVQWKIGVTPFYAELDRESLRCIAADPVAFAELTKAPLHAVVRVHFTGGAVTDAVLAGTSGDPDLDPKVVACYRNMPRESTAQVPDGDELFVAMLPPDL